MLGKRTSSRAVRKQEQPEEDEDGNIVAKVETREPINSNDDIITFDGDKKKKRKKDPNELPQSLVERYGSDIKLTKREQRRLQHSQNSKKKNNEHKELADDKSDDEEEEEPR